MDKQKIDGGLEKTAGRIKVNTGQAIGSRHANTKGEAKKTEVGSRNGMGDALDAVREVVNNEK